MLVCERMDFILFLYFFVLLLLYLDAYVSCIVNVTLWPPVLLFLIGRQKVFKIIIG